MLTAIATATGRTPSRGPASLRADWDGLARLDPLWAILSLGDRRFGKWDLDAFLATGQHQVDQHLANARRLGHPTGWGSVLDFGCGVGRMAPALSAHFDTYCGVDVSPAMVSEAQGLHAGLANCSFRTLAPDRAPQLKEMAFDLVISQYVLQHQLSRDAMASCLAALTRAVRPGGLLVVQFPASMPAAEWLLYAARRRTYQLGRALRLPQAWLHRAHLSPMATTCLPDAEARSVIGAEGLTVAEVVRARGGLAIEDRTYYAIRPAPGHRP